MGFFTSIDMYCERTSPELWAEPLNALSNISPLFAGLVGLLLFLNTTQRPKVLLPFSLLVLMVACGSFLFHTFAQNWAYLLDVLPILTFQCLCLDFALKKLFTYQNLKRITLVFLFITFTFLGSIVFKDWLNGSLGYLPSLIFLILLHFKTKNLKPQLSPLSCKILISFLFALVFRTIDSWLCPIFPWGSHFLWHLLIGLVFYFCLSYIHQFNEK